MLLQYLYTESEVCTRTGYELYDLLFVSLFVHHFLAYSGVLGLIKVSLSLMKMDLVIKLTFLRPPFESDHLEAQKACFLVTWMRVKLSF